MLLDGAVKGYDLQSTLIKIQDAFKGQSMTEENRPDAETRFAELSADFNVVQGVFQTENMSMKAPAFRVNGRGTMDLPRQNLDYKLDVSVVESLEGQGGQSLDKLKGITIPLKVYGALDAPSYALDLGGLLKAQASKELKKRLLEELVPIEAESDAGIASAGPTDQAAQEEVETDPKEVLKKELKKSLFKAFGLD